MQGDFLNAQKVTKDASGRGGIPISLPSRNPPLLKTALQGACGPLAREATPKESGDETECEKC